ncbi:MAG: DNA polymerase III subunit gamma/tau [Candidatus Margulisiibacteriota bacterium]
MSQTFYRKYRSQSFADIVGQQHIVRTLGNAITGDRLSQAYIFSGPRGTGKTSMARILAKSLNCRNGKTTTPCLTCDLCEKITRGSAVDVIEIDAASNTGVDNIRVLNEQIHFAPVECVYKLYIIDEAHMLSTGAFNALLKTLEEPPANTLFVLATTEPHKLPITIHSRCQQLHFKKLTLNEVIGHLGSIAAHEGIAIPEAGLHLIAQNAGGSLRDALTLLNQVYSFKGTSIDTDDVSFLLGSASIDQLIQFTQQMLGKNAPEAMTTLMSMINGGVHVLQLNADICLIFKQLLYLKLSLSELLDVDESRLQALQTVAKTASFEDIRTLLEAFAKLETDLRWFPNPELLIQIKCLSLLHGTSTPPVQQVAAVQAQPEPPRPAPVAPPPPPKPVPPAPVAPEPVATAPAAQAKPAPMAPVAPQPQVQAPAPAPQPVAQPTPEPEPKEDLPPMPSGSPSIEGAWKPFLDHLKTHNRALYTIVSSNAMPLAHLGDTLYIKLKQDFKFYREKLAEPASQSAIREGLSAAFGSPLKWVIGDPPSTTQTSQATPETAQAAAPTPPPPPTFKTPPQKLNDIIALFEGTLL